MIHFAANGEALDVYQSGTKLGTIRLTENPYHRTNCYVSLHLDSFNPAVSAELFERLAQRVNRPLQVMASSSEMEITAFLTAGGLVCRRKCFESEVSQADYIGQPLHSPLLHAHPGEVDYLSCCRLLYEHYLWTHRTVNPWTAGFADFCSMLPSEAVYEKKGGKVSQLAFIEGNEIAYIAGEKPSELLPFASSLITWLLTLHEKLCFESDDCDWAAMQLRSLFIHQSETSFDTWLYPLQPVCAGGSPANR